MRHASCLKARKPRASKRGDVATPLRAMTDDFPIKGAATQRNPQNKEVKKAENGQQTNKKPKTTNGYNTLKDKLTIATFVKNQVNTRLHPNNAVLQ